MEDKFQQLHDQYHQKVYSKSNRIDGKFEGMMYIYENMYGKFMPEDPEALIADLACGSGQFLKYLQNKGYTNFKGVEISKGQAEYADTITPGKVALMDVFDYLSLGDKHDLIVANDFIEHLTRERGIEFTGKVYESLKPGGRIILKTGNMAAFGGLVIWCNGLDHECGYTERSLNALLGISGFDQIEIIPYRERRRLYNWSQAVFHYGLGKMYKYLYSGNYPKCLTKLIAVTGVKK